MVRLALFLSVLFAIGFHSGTYAQDRLTNTFVDSLVENYKDLPPNQKTDRISALLDSLSGLPNEQIANAYTEIGIAYCSLNQFSSAIYYYDKAAALSLSSDDKNQYSRALNLKGISLSRLHQYGKAIEPFKRALEVREEIGDKQLIASTLNNLAICFRSTNQFDAAIKNYQLSHKLYKEVGDVTGQSFSLNNIGLVLLSTEDYAGAKEYLTKSLEIKVLLADTLSMANTFNNLGKVYYKTNNTKLALENLEMAVSYYEAANNNYGIADSYNCIAGVHLTLGNHTLVREYINRAKLLINFNETSNLALDNIKLQSDYFLAAGSLARSRDLLSEYIQRYSVVQNAIVNNQVAELSFMYESDRLEQERHLLEMNLDIEKLKVEKAKIKQYAVTIFATLLFLLLIASLLFIRKYRRNSAELEKVNAELNRVNFQLETIVDSRTHDLLETLKRAQESDKQKSAFLASMSHEIRTPLNGILGFSKLLTDDSLAQSERNEYVGLINRRGRSLLQIVNDIINFSLIDSGEVKIHNVSFNLNQLLYDLYTVFNSSDYEKRKANVELKLNLSLSDSRSMIMSDPNRIEQIISNLLDNAFKFTSIGQIEYGYTVQPNNTIKFFVRDTGPGITPDKRDLVFKKFNRTDDELARGFSATGLGLPICKGLVGLLNGQIWFETKVDEGTTFFFTIPFMPGKTSNKTYISRSSVQSISFKGRVILVVEDDLISYQFIQALLIPTEAKVIHAKNGEDAIEIVNIRTDIDLIVMDMRLPFIDGYEATVRIKSLNPHMAIIAQTANAMSYDREKCISVGCDDYLPKPIDPDDFLRTVAYHLKKPLLA